MGEVFVVGVATTSPGGAAATMADQIHATALAAIADAGLTVANVSAVAVGLACETVDSACADAVSMRLALRRLGLVHAAGAPGADANVSLAHATHAGWKAVERGSYDLVLCLGASGLPGPELPIDAAQPGASAQTLRSYAAAAQSYMTASGATVEHLAKVAVKNRCHAAMNPRAGCCAGELRVQDVLRSDVVAAPLTRLMVARQGGGAAAAVLASAAARRRLVGRAPRMCASVVAFEAGDVEANTSRAARLAYEAAAVDPEDIDCAEVHDSTAAAELVAYEALQFAPVGQGSELIDSGFTALGGVLPVNTSGGLLSLGERAGTESVAQVCELTWQLRCQAGASQVERARVGLAHSGAGPRNEPRSVAVTILTAA